MKTCTESGAFSCMMKKGGTMDSNIIEALTYAEDMARNIQEDYEHGKATEKEAVIRMFHLGKCLLGWDQDDERSDVEIIQSLLAMNRIVTEAIDESSKKMAS